MPDNELQFWEPIEGPTENDAQQMRSRLDMPTPPTGSQCGGDFRGIAALIGCLDHALRWGRGMKVNWYAKSLGAFKDWPEERIIEIAAPAMTIDHRAFETMLLDYPLQLVRSGTSICGG